MSTRHSHRWIAWLLPLFLLRAFVPVGFMLAWSHEGLQIVMCSGSGPVTPLNAPGTQLHQHGDTAPDTGEHHHSRADATTMCVFAVAGTSAAPPSTDTAFTFVATVSHEVRGLPELDLPVTPVLIDRIRGPPLA